MTGIPSDLLNRLTDFSQTVIAPLAENMGTIGHFPDNLFSEFGASQLLGLAVPKTDGGHGGNLSWIQKGGELITRHGTNIGVALSWMIHELVTGYLISPHAGPEFKQRWLPELISGKISVSFAVSEPKVGPHPKRLTTRMEKTPEGLFINGSKTYLTNGPIAGLYIVIAISDIIDGRKAYSAVGIPAATPGCTRHAPMEIPFFKPAPHGGVSFDNCTVPFDYLIGSSHTAYDDIVLAFRPLEDVAMMGIVVGALACQLDRMRGHLSERTDLPDDAYLHIGEIDSRIGVLGSLAESCAQQTLTPVETGPSPVSFLSVFREISGNTNGLFAKLHDVAGISMDTVDTISSVLHKDLNLSAGLARTALEQKLKRTGKRLCSA